MSATFDSIPNVSPRTIRFSRGGFLFLWALRSFCAVALAITGYLAVTALRSGDVAGCGNGALWDCGYALHSRWAKVFGVPVSIPAFGLYASMLIALCCCKPVVTRFGSQLAWKVVTAGALLAGLAAAWFISLQVFAVGHLCIYCIAAHACGIALCASILWKRPLGARQTTWLSGVSVLALSVLVAGQSLSSPPQTFKVEHYPMDVARKDVTVDSAPNANSQHQSKQPVSNVFEPPSTEIFEPPMAVPADIAENGSTENE